MAVSGEAREAKDAEHSEPMSRARRWLVTSLIIAFLLLSAHQVVARRDDWPLSSFSMYSGMQGQWFSRVTLVGVSETGEFGLDNEMTHPISGPILRYVLGRLSKDQDKYRQALTLFKDIYDERKAAGAHAGQELRAVRLYSTNWKIKADLSNLTSVRPKLVSSAVFLPQEVEQSLQDEARGRANPCAKPPLSVKEDDIVLTASNADAIGDVEITDDPCAHGGKALLFEGKGSLKQPDPVAGNYAEFVFEAKAGKYFVWLRGKSNGSEDSDSAWLQFDGEIGTKRSGSGIGYGNWKSLYPEAYAWSSVSPGAPAASVELTRDGLHRLRVTAREPSFRIDEIWLSARQALEPQFHGPVTATKR